MTVLLEYGYYDRAQYPSAAISEATVVRGERREASGWSTRIVRAIQGLFMLLCFTAAFSGSAVAALITQTVRVDVPFTVLSGEVGTTLSLDPIPFDRFDPALGTLRAVDLAVSPVGVFHSVVFEINLNEFPPPSPPADQFGPTWNHIFELRVSSLPALGNTGAMGALMSLESFAQIPPGFELPVIDAPHEVFDDRIFFNGSPMFIRKLIPPDLVLLEGPRQSSVFDILPPTGVSSPASPAFVGSDEFPVSLTFEYLAFNLDRRTPPELFDPLAITVLESKFDAGPFNLSLTYTYDPLAAAEPPAIALLGLGIALLLFWRCPRRTRRNSAFS